MGTPAAERDRLVARFKAALDEAGMGVGMGTTNLFGHPAFKDGRSRPTTGKSGAPRSASR